MGYCLPCFNKKHNTHYEIANVQLSAPDLCSGDDCHRVTGLVREVKRTCGGCGEAWHKKTEGAVYCTTRGEFMCGKCCAKCLEDNGVCFDT